MSDSRTIDALAASGAAAYIALEKMKAFVGEAKTNEQYRLTIVRMINENLVSNDIVGAVLLGVEVGADILEAELDTVAKGDLNVQRTD